MLSPLLQGALDNIRQVTAGMTEEQLAAAPPGKWSPAQILEHLSLTYASSVKVMERALAEGRPQAGAATVRQRLSAAVVVGLGYIPSGRQAPEFSKPRGMAAGEVLPALEKHLLRMDEKISECEQRFGSSVRVGNHPVLGPLTCGGWRKFHNLHARHHMKQIQRLRA